MNQKMLFLALVFWLSSFLLFAQEEASVITRHFSEYQAFNFTPMAVVHDQQQRPFIYVAGKEGGLIIFDASDMENLEIQGRFPTSSFLKMQVMDITQEDNFLYLALGNASGFKETPGLGVVDVSDPTKPQLISVWVHNKKGKGAAAIKVKGKYAYLAAMSEGILILDISDARKISLVKKFVPYIHFPQKDPRKSRWPMAKNLAIKDNLLFLCYEAGGLRILDISNPNEPKELSNYINSDKKLQKQAYNNIVIDDSLAYVSVDYCGLEVINISKPNEPNQVAWWNPWDCHSPANNWNNSLGHTNQLILDQQRKLLFVAAGDSELQIVDISNAKQPKLAGSFGYPTDQLGAWGLAVQEQYVVLAYVKQIGLPFPSVWSGIKVIEWAKK